MIGDLINDLCESLFGLLPEGGFLADVVTQICDFLSDLFGGIGCCFV